MRTSRRRIILGSAALGALVLLALYWVKLHSYERWQPLPKGGEIRVLKAVYAEELIIGPSGSKLGALRDWLGPKWERFFEHEHGGSTTGFGGPTLAVAFACRGSQGRFRLGDTTCEIDLPNGQILQGESGGGGGDGDETSEIVTFQLHPFLERRFKMRLKIEGQTLHFDVPNPAFNPAVASWKAEVLPQTRKVGDLEITLKRVLGRTPDPYEHIGSPWAVEAEMSVMCGGRDVTQWVKRWPLIYDQGGNKAGTGIFSEPVWKMQVTAVKTDYYPFPDAEVNWLGRVAVPGPGEARIVPLTPATRAAKLSLLALVGPGHYRVADGKITPILIPAGTVAKESAIEDSGPSGSVVTDIDTTTVELLSMASTGLGDEQAGGPPLIFLRDANGKRLKFKMVAGLGETSLDVPLSALETPEVELGLREVEEVKAEFFVQPPPPPGREARSGK